MILPILDYYGAVFHRCGKGNEEGLECLQRGGGRTVFIILPICPPNRWLRALVRTPLREEEKTTMLIKLVEKCLKGTSPIYFSNYFQLKRHDIHDYDIRGKNRLVIDRVKLESTKRAFFL